VQRYAGRITVESAAGKGTTFRFTLPAATLATPTPG
jgi:signal transduction histidine kinase